MRIIGLTGSIACGKSTVSAFLSAGGTPVVDGDRLSRELTAPGSPVLGEIRACFGPGVFYEDGSLNRRALGRLVFSDASARGALDQLMAPHLLALTRQRLEEVRLSGAALCFLDMPLLFEKGYDRLCDSVWTVWLPEDVQLSRLMSRDGFTREEAESRIRSVLSSDEKAARANRVIDNSGSVEATYAIVSDFLAAELRLASAPPRPRRSRSAASDSRASAASVPSQPAASLPPQPAAGLPPQSAAGIRPGPGPAQAPVAAGYSPQPPTPVAAGYAPPAAPPVPEGFSRPEAARSRRKERRAAWRMPVWLRTSLIVATALLLVGITSLIWMNAYLRTCSEQHAAEQAEIDRQYPLPAEYRELIERYAREYNLSPAFVSAVIRNESSFRPTVESGDGARGLMQLMPDTAEWIARKLQVSGYAFERMNDPESNIRFGCWYLNYLSRLFLGDPVAVTAAYHAGQGQVKVWLSDPNLSEDGYSLPLSALPDGPTKNYAGRVTRDYGIYQEKYFAAAQLPADDSADDTGVSGAGV